MSKTKKRSPLIRVLSAFTALGTVTGALPVCPFSVLLPAYAEESGETIQIRDQSIRFDLNSGSLDNEKFNVTDGIAVLKDAGDPADTPQPEPPALSGLKFAGWTNAAGNAAELFEADSTYYASWSYDYSERTNPYSGLVNYVNHSNFYDFRGNNGNLKTTFGNNGYDIIYKLNNNRYVIGRNGAQATFTVQAGLAITPVFSFCDCNGNISENPEENLYTKVTYVIQNRSEEDIDNFGIASTADVQIGGNDHAAIYAYSDDDTQLDADNCADYNVKNIEMRDGAGNIFMLSIPEDAKCWWGYYGSRNTYAFADHSYSNYNVGYDSGIAYSWEGLEIPAGETIEKSVIFAIGDIHLFKTHTFNADGICNGGSGCPLAYDHTAERPTFFQKPQSFSENGNIRFEVRNAGQLMWLAENINNSEVATNINIDLVNDIRFNMNLTQKGDGSCEVSGNLAWTPISEYSGVFDGKNHTISGIFFNGIEEGGLFHILNGATVKNLSIVDSSFASDAKVGSIAASAKSGTIISDVCSTAAVSGDNAAGLVYDLEESTLTSAFFAGTGTEMLFDPGNEDSVVSNVFILSEDESIPYAASASAIASGSVAYALGRAWSQDLEFGDAVPYLGTDKRVYSYVQNHSCSLSDPQAETIYTNDAELSGTTQTVEHDLEWGIVVKQATCTENERWNKKCKNCGYETSELFDRMEDGLMATGHNHDSSGYCQNIDPNTGRKCNHYDSSYRVYSLEGASVALAADFSVSGITGSGWRAEDLSAFDITYGTDASHRSEALPTEPGTYYAFVTPNGTNTQYQGIAQSEAVEIYALNVAGQQVTSLIADDILGDGKFSYNKGTKTLQIKASNFNYEGTVIESSIDGLTISADSNVTLMTRSESKDCIILHKNATITGSGLINIIAGSEKAAGTEGGAAIRSDAKLTIKNVGITIVARSCILGGADKAALEIIDSNMNMIAHSDLGAISGFSGYTFTKCEITIPGATEITDGTVMDTTGETPVPAKCVNITAYSSILYDLYIASVQVSRANADDILGDGVLSFDPKTNTLTVNGDCVSEDSEPFIKNQIDGLTIDVVSDSKFSFENCTAITSFGHNLTITGEGKLKIYSQASSISVKQCVLTIKDTELTVCIAGDSVYGITGGLDNDTLEIINSMMCVEADSGAIVNFENGITLDKSVIVKPTNAFISDNAISDADGAPASIVKIMPMSIAPEIKTQPQDAIGDVGETAVFTVEATGRSLSFQWQYESAAGWTDSDLTGAKTNKLSVPITAERDGQQYRCVVSNLAGTVNSDSASIHIKAAITADPTDFTGSIGETAKFTVSVSGKNLKYQWQFKDGTTWKDSGMTGAQTATLSVPIIEARDGQQYRCVVSNPAGNVISNPASIHIKAAITADPTDFTGFVGETAKFTVTASGKNLKYQWQFKDGAIWKESGMNGAKTATLSVPIIEARDGQQYRCIVSNSFGSETSDAASIQVKAVITAQPTVQTLELNQTAKFTVAATGTNLTYQWQFLDVNTWKNSGMTGANTATLSVPVTAARDGQQYRCIVKSSNGTSDISSPASIKVKTAITAQPTNQTGKIDSTVKFTVAATGTNLKYQWQFLSTSGWKNSGMTGANTATLSVPVTAARDGQQYKCVITSSNGTSATTNAVKLIVGVKITAQPKDYTGNVGTDAKFTVSAAGNNLSYQWQFNDNGVWKDSGMTGAKTNMLSVPITAARNGQKYRCVVKSANDTSETSTAATLKAIVNTITGQPQNATGKVGETVKFTVTASNATYQWQFLSTSGWQNSGMTGATTATISVPVTEARDGQKYRCVVKFADGTTKTSNEATLTVKAAVTGQPQNVTAKVGTTAKFTVTASGTNLTYQWQFLSSTGWQNSGMEGAKTATISVPVTAARNGQQYRCVVTSANGTTEISNAAKLTVNG